MKQTVSLIALLCLAFTASHAQLITRTFTTKTFATAVNRTDTSAAVRIYEHPYIEVGTYTIGTDSLKLIIAYDYLIGTVWLTGARDTIKYGAGTTGSKAVGRMLRQPSSVATPGATAVRIRNTLVPFRTADSTSATSYTQYVVQRKDPN